jgi:hypothetical protein
MYYVALKLFQFGSEGGQRARESSELICHVFRLLEPISTLAPGVINGWKWDVDMFHGTQNDIYHHK